MTGTLHVLLIESEPGAGDHHARDLEASGHAVHHGCEPWLAARVDGDVAAACEAAAAADLAALAREVSRRVGLVLRSAGIAPETVACRVQPSGSDLRVVFTGPAIGPSRRSALAVRALDAIHSSARRTYGQVDVDYVERDA